MANNHFIPPPAPMHPLHFPQQAPSQSPSRAQQPAPPTYQQPFTPRQYPQAETFQTRHQQYRLPGAPAPSRAEPSSVPAYIPGTDGYPQLLSSIYDSFIQPPAGYVQTPQTSPLRAQGFTQGRQHGQHASQQSPSRPGGTAQTSHHNRTSSQHITRASTPASALPPASSTRRKIKRETSLAPSANDEEYVPSSSRRPARRDTSLAPSMDDELPHSGTRHRARRGTSLAPSAADDDELQYLRTSVASGVDLHSLSATATPDFVFPTAAEYKEEIYVLRVTHPLKACLLMKQFFISQFGGEGEGVLRMETMQLEKIKADAKGKLVLLPDAAKLRVGGRDVGVSIVAIVVAHAERIRWAYSPLSTSPLLARLAEEDCLDETKMTYISPHNTKHKRLATFFLHTFATALVPPHSRAYLSAQKLTDYSLPIKDPDTAIARLDSNKELYFSHAGASEPRDLSEDRYLLHLTPPERYLASDLKLRCADYLLIKRRFFSAFWREMVAKKESLGKVWSEKAHEKWLAENSEGRLRGGRARRLVLAWRILGLLEEGRYEGILVDGGWLEITEEDGDEGGEKNGGGGGASEKAGGVEGSGSRGLVRGTREGRRREGDE